MSKQTKKKNLPGQPVEGHPHVLAHFLFGCAGLLAIIYGAVLLLSRTEGMRYVVRDKIEEEIGMPVSIGAMRVTAGLDVILEDVTAGKDKTIQIRQAKITGSLWEKLQGRPWLQSADVAGGTLMLTQSSEGRWMPAACAPMSDWLTRYGGIVLPVPHQAAAENKSAGPAAEKSVDAGDLHFADDRDSRNHIPLMLRNGRIMWQDAQGNELASAGDIEIHLTPLKIQAREMRHVVFSAGHIRSASGDYITGLFVELLSTQGHHILLAERSNRTQSAAPPVSSAYEQTYEAGVPDYPP
ncbi:MAG: hypothetical protein AB7T27_01130 [Kiritimatiellia bacterium]